jgi:hypothetical protein
MPWNITAPSDRELIRCYLGYPISDVALGRIQDQMNQVEGIGGEDAVITVQGFLSQLTAIDGKLNTARDTAAVADEAIADEDAPIDKSYFKGEAMRVLREEGRRYVKELSATLELVIQRDVFATTTTTTASTLFRRS